MPTPSILIAAWSGRALAQSARRAGYAALVVDGFGDLDMREAAAAWHVYPEATTQGFAAGSLIAALDALARGSEPPPLGLVLGSGFDHVPNVIAELARHYPLLGNMAGTVGRVTDPAWFFPVLETFGIPFPETRLVPLGTETASAWLAKRAGGGGGLHVAPYAAGTAVPSGYYLQRRSPGDAISALCVMGAGAGRLVGLTRQWTDPTLDHPFRYGGAVGPIVVPHSLREKILGIVDSLAAAFRLKGLVALDFIVANGIPYLLEINPRPGATLDVLDDAAGSLFAAHVAATLPSLPAGEKRGLGDSPLSSLPQSPLKEPEERSGNSVLPRAAAYLYADRGALRIPPLDWPPWAADRSPPGTPIPAHGPAATVLAEGTTPVAAEQLCRERLAALTKMLYEHR